MSRRSHPSKPSRGRARLAYLRGRTDVAIARTAPRELPMFPEEFWEAAHVEMPVSKEAISLRVDEDVLEWFRSAGPRYQSRMNAVLRSYVTHMKSRVSRRPSNRRLRRSSTRRTANKQVSSRRASSIEKSPSRRRGARR